MRPPSKKTSMWTTLLALTHSGRKINVDFPQKIQLSKPSVKLVLVFF